LSGKRRSAIITTIIGGELESSSRSLPFLFIAKKRDGAVQQRGLMSRFYSFWGTFSKWEKRGRIPVALRFFLHRLSGGHEPRRRFALTGGEFFAEPQRGIALCGARETAASAAGTKRKGHLRFPFLFELLPFPCFPIWRQSESGDRFEKGNGSRFILP